MFCFSTKVLKLAVTIRAVLAQNARKRAVGLAPPDPLRKHTALPNPLAGFSFKGPTPTSIREGSGLPDQGQILPTGPECDIYTYLTEIRAEGIPVSRQVCSLRVKLVT